MIGREPTAVLHDVGALFHEGSVVGLTDGQLLERFTARSDDVAEVAFSALVQRHGPMVWGVCRRLLDDPNDVADAFQATFLVLAHRATTVRGEDALGRWLYGVSRKVATRARKILLQRSSREYVGLEEVTAPVLDPDRAEWLEVLDEEIGRLPERYRDAVVLCDLDGLTHEEAARQLGCAVGTVGSRISRARERLRAGLTRRGFTLSVGTLAITLGSQRTAAAAPAALELATVRTAILMASGHAASGTTAIAKLAGAVLRSMALSRLKWVALVVLAIAAGACGTGVLAFQTPQRSEVPNALAGVSGEPSPTRTGPARPERNSTPPSANPARKVTNEPGEQRATSLAREVHSQAGAFDKLPRFSYRVRYRYGTVDSMRAIDPTFDKFKEGLRAPVLASDWFPWYQTCFSWDQDRFLWSLNPDESPLGNGFRFWTQTEGWERHEAQDKSSRNFVHTAGPATLWKSLDFFDYSYLRLTPHRYRWGQTVKFNGQCMSLVPPERASWKHVGIEEFGGEKCDVLDSRQRTERLWIGQESKRLHGVLTYRVEVEQPDILKFYQSDAVHRIAGKPFASMWEYSNWCFSEASEGQLIEAAVAWNALDPTPDPSKITPGELVIFDDYREVSPGVWLPFREVRTFAHSSQTVKDKSKLIRSELLVQEVRTDLNLAEPFKALLPKEGDQVQDQRFQVPINLHYRADQTDDEIRKLAETEYSKRLQGQDLIKQLVAPVKALVGKPAPPLPETGWIGDPPRNLAGKPYLLRFWATWCGPCKNDIPLLRALVQKGVTIVGMHPSGTPLDEVQKAARDQAIDQATLLETTNEGTGANRKIGGYPAGVFPYYVLVDAQGRVAGQGFLTDLMKEVDGDALIGTGKDKARLK